jgi:hypothetical protein
VWPSGEHHCPGVLLRLQEARNDQRFERSKFGGRGFKPDVGTGENRAIELPPAALLGLTGHFDEFFALRPDDLVGGQDLTDVAGADARLAGLDPGDLRGGALHSLGDLIDGGTGGFPQPAQFLSELTTP